MDKLSKMILTYIKAHETLINSRKRHLKWLQPLHAFESDIGKLSHKHMFLKVTCLR